MEFLKLSLICCRLQTGWAYGGGSVAAVTVFTYVFSSNYNLLSMTTPWYLGSTDGCDFLLKCTHMSSVLAAFSFTEDFSHRSIKASPTAPGAVSTPLTDDYYDCIICELQSESSRTGTSAVISVHDIWKGWQERGPVGKGSATLGSCHRKV